TREQIDELALREGDLEEDLRTHAGGYEADPAAAQELTQTYLEDLRNGRTFGSTIELYAISQLCQVNVQVWEGENRPQLFPGNEDPKQTLHPLRVGAHYDYYEAAHNLPEYRQ